MLFDINRHAAVKSTLLIADPAPLTDRLMADENLPFAVSFVTNEHQPPTLIVWGQNDYIFPADGAHPYKRDLINLDFHLLDTGHFALEEDGLAIASHIRRFLGQQVASKRGHNKEG